MNHYMVTLVRTEPASENRRAGMSQFIVDQLGIGWAQLTHWLVYLTNHRLFSPWLRAFYEYSPFKTTG